jgi:uncharacterized membrane protein
MKYKVRGMKRGLIKTIFGLLFAIMLAVAFIYLGLSKDTPISEAFLLLGGIGIFVAITVVIAFVKGIL